MIFISFISEISLAAGRFDNNSDILGINLMMTKAQAVDHVKNKYYGHPITMIPVAVTMANVSENTVAGFIFQPDINTFPSDWLVVLYDPNQKSNDIFGVSRRVVYINKLYCDDKDRLVGNGTWVIRDNVVDELVSKYGKPDAYYTGDNENYVQTEFFYWALKKSALNSGQTSAYSCISSYLNELKIDGSGYDYNKKEMVDKISTNFVEVFGPLVHLGVYKDCGMVLRVCIHRTSKSALPGVNYPYVASVDMDLIDLSKGTIKMEAFADELSSREYNEGREQWQKEMKNKPLF
jgi:hypothetical protein